MLPLVSIRRFTICLIVTLTTVAVAEPPSVVETANKVDQLVLSEGGVSELGIIDDATFLRRASLDIVGRPPTVGELTRFGLLPSSDKRAQVVATLLGSEEYGKNWSRYWRDAVFHRATNVRSNLVQPAFEEWMSAQLNTNQPWDAVVTKLLTARGPVNNDGSTALIFAHEGEPEEIAAEASRLFLGIQLQCANCHDHPWDSWKREQFHQLVAFFPRISVRRDPASENMFDYVIASVDRDRSRRPGVSQFFLTRIDRNRDQVISEGEAKGTPLERLLSGQAKSIIDRNGDGVLTIEEIRTAQPADNNRPGQGSTEHYMADLSDPGSKGTLVNPAFFVGATDIRTGLSDVARRNTVADFFTMADNPWFARAIVNRMWFELTGSAFYTPIDDMGPQRESMHPLALDLLCQGFVANGHDLQWLISTICATSLYQRPVNTEAAGFQRLEPTRLRADQLYDSLCQALNIESLPLAFTGRRSPYAFNQDRGRLQFNSVFGFDPSTPRAEITGSVPETLFMMNAPELERIIKTDQPEATLNRISRSVLLDEDVIRELYLSTVCRQPTLTELNLCQQHLDAAGNRRAGLEDIFWTLLNSAEFSSKH